ncbi:hypothetical protein GRJ2_000235000 [Grus japonensis]|uniref:Uncharacterized protein n=1 Tax=Grus japonensis TaxID=30415 RepID=A0ABC9W0Y2_GRUJA
MSGRARKGEGSGPQRTAGPGGRRSSSSGCGSSWKSVKDTLGERRSSVLAFFTRGSAERSPPLHSYC